MATVMVLWGNLPAAAVGATAGPPALVAAAGAVVAGAAAALVGAVVGAAVAAAGFGGVVGAATAVGALVGAGAAGWVQLARSPCPTVAEATRAIHVTS